MFYVQLAPLGGILGPLKSERNIFLGPLVRILNFTFSESSHLAKTESLLIFVEQNCLQATCGPFRLSMVALQMVCGGLLENGLFKFLQNSLYWKAFKTYLADVTEIYFSEKCYEQTK